MKIKRLVYAYRTVKHGFKFARKGKGCRFPGKDLEVDGHVELGDHCRFRNDVVMRTKGKGKIVFGTYSGMSYHCIAEATKFIKVGSFTGIAEFCVLRDTNHMVFGTGEHWRMTPQIADPIVIGDCCLILSGCYIGPGVSIGFGAVVAPGSFVTKDIAPFEVWSGNPAKKIAHRLEGPIAGMMKRRYQQLLDEEAVKKSRYGYNDDELRAEALDGVDRAAEERDRLREELGILVPKGTR